MEQILPQRLQREPILPTPYFELLASLNCERENLLFQATHVVIIYCGSARKLIHTCLTMISSKEEILYISILFEYFTVRIYYCMANFFANKNKLPTFYVGSFDPATYQV